MLAISLDDNVYLYIDNEIKYCVTPKTKKPVFDTL